MKNIKFLVPVALALITLSCKKTEGLEEGILSGTYIGTQEYSRINSDGVEVQDSTYELSTEVTYSKGSYIIVGETVNVVSKEELDDFTHDIEENDGSYRLNYTFNGDQLSIKIVSRELNGPIDRWNFLGERE